MRALLVGGTGFISSALARRLYFEGVDVTVVARGLRDDVLPEGVERLKVDRCVPGTLDRALAGRSFDVVYDFFAHEANAPRQVFALLPDRRRMGRYVLLSSGAVYEVPLRGEVTEEHPVGPRDPYGRGKLDAERAAMACARACAIPLTIVRPNETLGPRDATGRRFLHLVQRAARGRPIVVPGRLDNRLRWGFVEDLALLLALCARSTREDARIYNAAGRDHTFGDYLAAIFGALGKTVPVRVVGAPCEGLEWYLNCTEDAVISVGRARDELGWEPRTTIAGAVSACVAWLARERRDVFEEDPPDALRARAHEERGKLVPLEPISEPLIELPESAPPPAAREGGDLLPSEIALLAPLMRSSAAIDRAALLGAAATIARAGDPSASLARLDEALSGLEERALVLPAEKDGLPAFRISADGFLDLLAACARPPSEMTPPALLVRFHVLARAMLIEGGAGSIDPFALGIPFEIPTRTGAEALPAGILDRFGGSFGDFARFFHDSLDRSALVRWKGALRRHRASLLEESERLAQESARIDRGALADEGTRSKLVHQIEIARSPSEPVEVRWVERAFLDRQTLVLPALALAEALLGAISRLEALLVPPETAREGDLAPDFSAPSSRGSVALSTLRGRWVVLYFYPVDDTPGCTLEACRFRDLRAVFEEAGATVLGVSTQDATSHKAFSAKHGLDFELVADPEGRIARAYGVFDERHGWADRVTFLIDPAGRIARIFKVAKIEEHAGEVLAALRRR
ncbi:MAG TPA: redoxin domain-containing protein [Planctomycetota bacterium]|nr:redoxin domain-containing protein [Planctomycetota bacterium]